ncbi:chemotaxis protein CheA [Parasphingopyxis sp.]|uniref:chemotaxis protein CheA n=1 Tax=Parasphingopyxis sp. TaxID=1920299 RepID=UPI0026055299|nr:chemotaxis protein CheA [Parasphingopyxis sp.]
MDDLLAEFIAETRETLDTISGEIVAWEADPGDRKRLDAIFRFFHTVKGSCGFLDLTHIQRVAHEAEQALSELRDGTREPTPRLVSTILAVMDRIGAMADALERGEEIDESHDEPLIAALGGKDDEAAAPALRTATEMRHPARSIRVPLELLDRLMGGVSDLVLARNELSRQLRRTAGEDQVETAFERMSTCVAEMRDAITWARMQRIESLFAALPRLVRDLSAELGKSVQLDIDGADVELDREMIEMLRDPLTHIVRNALDHGIEPPEGRRAAGKPETSILRIGARQSGNQIQISIADDGRGIDPHMLKDRAVQGASLSAEAAQSMSDVDALELIFQPGLSTADAVSTVSGRGVGMDVVRSNVERIGGSIDIESVVGQGTTLSLLVPLTLTIIPALIFGVGEGRYAIPRANIEEIVSLGRDRAEIEAIGGTEAALIRRKRLPVVRLAAVMDMDHAESAASGTDRAQHLVVVRASRRERFAVMVSAVFDHEELVVKPAAPSVMQAGFYAGTALPDNGMPLLLLDIAGLAAVAGLRLGMADPQENRVAAEPDAATDVLIFTDLDGCRRAVRMALVNRIVDADADQIVERAGGLRLVIDEETVPVVASGDLPKTGHVRLLRLSDGESAIAYAIGEGAADVGKFPETFDRARGTGRILGVAVVDGEPVELLDAHFLFAEFSERPAISVEQPRCLVIGGDDLWRRELLAPLIEQAGYRVTFDEDAEYDVAIDASGTDQDSDGQDFEGTEADVVRLSADPSPGKDRIYRYDRTGIVDALHARRKRRASG